MFYIHQTNDSGCGFACLKMMLANIRHDKKYLYMPDKKEKAMSYKEIISAASKQRRAAFNGL